MCFPPPSRPPPHPPLPLLSFTILTVLPTCCYLFSFPSLTPASLSLSFFLSLSLCLFCSSEPIRAAQRRVTQTSGEANTQDVWLRESETLAEIVQNPSDTPSRTHTQMARKNRKWSHCMHPPFLRLPLPSSTNPRGRCLTTKESRKDRGSVQGARMT